MKSVYTLAALCILVLMVVSGCATTTQTKVEVTPGICTFLGEDVCSRLTAGEKGQAALRWVNPNAQPTQYDKVMIQVIAFVGSDKASPDEQQTLVDYFQTALSDKLASKYPIVDRPGPGVLRIQVAILDAEAATPGVRSVSVVVPQVKLLGAASSLAREGKFPFSGGAEAAWKITDSMTGQVLAGAVDRRVGGGSIASAAQWQWGDAKNAIDAWAQLTADRLYAYTSGAEKS